MSLSGHSALVTGGTQGVGQAIALALANAGANVVIHGLREDDSARSTLERCREAGVEAHLLVADLSVDPHLASREIYAHAKSLVSELDLLVCNAGTFIDSPFLEMEFETFDRTMKLNVYSYYFLSQAAAQDWVERGTAGRMLLVGSINGRLAEPDHTAYDTSKGAVEAMVKSLCVSMAPHRIRVNGLAPGLFRTPLTEPAFEDPKFLPWMELHTPNGSVPDASVCGEAAVFLLGDAAEHIHGHMLMVDGGMSIWQQPDLPTDP